MRLHVVQRKTFGIEKGFQCANLIGHEISNFRRRKDHGPAAEALKIGQRWVCADLDLVLFRKTNRLAHDRRIRAMKSAGDIGKIDVGHHRRIVAKAIKAEPLAHVAVYRQPHVTGLSSICLRRQPDFYWRR